MTMMFKIYFASVLLLLVIVGLFGLAVPKLISAKSDELVLAGVLVSVFSVVPITYLVNYIVKIQITLRMESDMIASLKSRNKK